MFFRKLTSSSKPAPKSPLLFLPPPLFLAAFLEAAAAAESPVAFPATKRTPAGLFNKATSLEDIAFTALSVVIKPVAKRTDISSTHKL